MKAKKELIDHDLFSRMSSSQSIFAEFQEAKQMNFILDLADEKSCNGVFAGLQIRGPFSSHIEQQLRQKLIYKQN